MSALRPRSARLAGASLVEMVVAVAVLGIVALIAVPRADPVASFAADAAAGDIANALRFAQQEAIRTGRYHIVRIDPATQALSVTALTTVGAVGTDAAFRVLHPVERRDYLLNFTNNGSASSTIVGSWFQYAGGGASANFASFGPDGVPASVSGVWTNRVPSVRNLLLLPGVVTLRHGQAERQVRLDRVTGRVTY